jgi:predicted PurR-regulated permease PerM
MNAAAKKLAVAARATAATSTTQGPAPDGWARAQAIATVALAVLAALAAVAFARPVLMPIVAGVMVGFILGPLAERGARVGVPVVLSNVAIVVFVLGALWLGYILLAPAIFDALERAPEIGQSLREKLGGLERSLALLANLGQIFGERAATGLTVRVDQGQAAALTTVVGAVTPAFAQLVIFVFSLILFLASRRSLRDRIVLAFEGRESRLATLKVFSAIEDRMLSYFATVSVINLGLGALTGVALYLIGMPGAPVWACLIFLLNFLPVVGPLIVKALLLGAGVLFMPTLYWALAPLAIYLTLQVIEANFVTPHVVGRRLTLEPLLIFVAICFFTWMWGPVGGFLATPIVIVALIIHQHATPADEPLPLPDREEPRVAGQR